MTAVRCCLPEAARRARRRTPQRALNQRGLALIIVLWTAAIITMLAASFSFSLRTEARLSAGAVERAQAGAAAAAGLTVLMQQLLSPGKDPLAADTRLSFEGFDVALQVLPENAKVDVNAAPEALLGNLIAQSVERADLDPALAVAVTDAILDWRDADTKVRPHGAEAADYVTAGRVVGPRNGALLSVSELNQVMGMNAALFRALKPLVTVHAWSTKVAPMSASREVLLAVPGLSTEQVEAFIDVRGELADTRQAIAMLGSGARYLARSESAVYTLIARAKAPSGVQALRRAVVKFSGNTARPVSILAWYEDAGSEAGVGSEQNDESEPAVQPGV